MDKKQFAKFAMALKTYYPRENVLPNEQAMELWFFQLQDIQYNVAEAGLNKWVATNKFAPTIAEIRETAASISNGDLPDWGDAWLEVCRAISRYGSYRPKEAIESMSPLARRAAERIGFINLCMSENPSADRANFRMIYEQLAEREKKNAQLPEPLKQLIAQMQGNLIETNEGK